MGVEAQQLCPGGHVRWRPRPPAPALCARLQCLDLRPPAKTRRPPGCGHPSLGLSPSRWLNIPPSPSGPEALDPSLFQDLMSPHGSAQIQPKLHILTGPRGTWEPGCPLLCGRREAGEEARAGREPVTRAWPVTYTSAQGPNLLCPLHGPPLSSTERPPDWSQLWGQQDARSR